MDVVESNPSVMDYGRFWFEEKENQAHANLFATLKQMESRQAYRQLENLQHFKLYANCDFFNYTIRDYAYQTSQNRLKINVIQQIISSLQSKITKNKPKPTFLTDYADWSLKQKAKQLDAYMYGRFYKSKVYEKAGEQFLYSCIFGTGFLKVYPDKELKEVCIENIHPDEIKVDDREAFYGNPRNLYQLKEVSKNYLISQYPEFKKEIDNSQKIRSVYYGYVADRVESDLVTVVEGWHLPDYGGENGRHVICISGATLVDEEYKRDVFPFVKLPFQHRGVGYYGRGVPELLYGIQLEINRAFDRIQKSLHLTNVPRILYEYSSKIVKAHFNNEVGSMIGYAGTPPQFINPTGISQDYMGWLQYMIQRSFEEIGISEMGATSKKPEGLDSGKAIREYSDIETDRFANLSQRWEENFMEISRQVIECERIIGEEDSSHAVLAKFKDGTKKIKWKDVNIDEDSYIMQVYPTSLLSQHPAGRLSDINEMIGMGLLSPDEAANLLDFPDIKESMRFKTAHSDDIMAVIEDILDGKYNPPEPLQNLQLGLKMVQQAYLYYKNRGVKEEVLELFRRWASDAIALTQPTQEEMAQQQAQQMQAQQMAEPQMPATQASGTTLEGQI